MSDTASTRVLSIVLMVVGVIFVVGIVLLGQIWPSGWVWHDSGRSVYFEMILGVYATLGVFLVRASRRPLENLSLIWFTVWSSLAHAVIMAAQALQQPEHRGHLLGDVPALIIVALVLAALTPRRTAASLATAA
jgi:hypothetical protein